MQILVEFKPKSSDHEVWAQTGSFWVHQSEASTPLAMSPEAKSQGDIVQKYIWHTN